MYTIDVYIDVYPLRISTTPRHLGPEVFSRWDVCPVPSSAHAFLLDWASWPFWLRCRFSWLGVLVAVLAEICCNRVVSSHTTWQSWHVIPLLEYWMCFRFSECCWWLIEMIYMSLQSFCFSLRFAKLRGFIMFPDIPVRHQPGWNLWALEPAQQGAAVPGCWRLPIGDPWLRNVRE